MKLQLVFFSVFLCVLSLSSQNVKLSISNPNAKDNSEVWFCRSIDGDPINYIVKYDKECFRHGEVVKSFSVDTTMFVMLADNPFLPKIRLVVCKNDSIHIQVDQDTITHRIVIQFSGDNSKGNANYYTNSLFSGGKTLGVVFPIMKNATSLSQAINQTEQLKARLFAPMDSLFANKEISNAYYQFVKLEGDAEFLNAVLSISNKLLSDHEADTCKLKEIDLKNFQAYYCNKYDPFSEKYRNVNYRAANARFKCVLISNGTLPSIQHSTDLKLWDKDNSHYNYASKEIQERMFASDLIFRQKFGMISEANSIEQYNHFQYIYFRIASFYP